MYDKKTNVSNLLFHCRKVEVDEENKIYVRQLLDSIDETLKRTGEEKLKLREGSYMDCNIELSERYNKGKISYKRLCELSKRVKDSLQELVRQHAFKVEAIREAISIEKVLRSEKLVKDDNYLTARRIEKDRDDRCGIFGKQKKVRVVTCCVCC